MASLHSAHDSNPDSTSVPRSLDSKISSHKVISSSQVRVTLTPKVSMARSSVECSILPNVLESHLP